MAPRSAWGQIKYIVHLDFKATSNMAEYEALLFGLSTALSLRVRQLLVKGDSQLIIMTEQVALMILPPDLERNLCRPPQKCQSSTRLGPQVLQPRPAREPRPPPKLGHEPLAAAYPGLLSTRDGLDWDPEALSACKWEGAEHS
jgi:hypothetical protein